MTFAVLALATAAAIAAVTIHLTMPTASLMAVRIVASELAAYLVTIELVALVLSLLALRDAPRIAAVLVAGAGLILALGPLLQLPGAIAAVDSALDAIGAPAASEPTFSVARLLTGLPRPEVRRTDDVPFRIIEGTTLRLDRYDGAGEGPHPALVVVHGGSWRNGDKGAGVLDPRSLNQILARRGITVYDIQYRLAPAAVFPAQLDDVLCALGHIRAHAAEDRVDAERVALLGRSAGAHLALLAAYRTGRDPVPTGCAMPATVRGVISLYGPTDLERGYRNPAEPDLIEGSRAIADFLGSTPDAMPATYALASPQGALDRPVPPTLLLHGQADQIVGPYHTTSLAASLSSHGDVVATVQLPWSGHGFDAIAWGTGGQLALAAVQRFLALVLAPG
ncbi:MAG: alpha/beta hydrolase [Chloroflexota bacterium]|nr:alpha/beta hydrolase [Chloroflexota bacterium]